MYSIAFICVCIMTEVNLNHYEWFLKHHANWDAHTGRTSTCSEMFWYRMLITRAFGPCSLFLLSGFFSFFFLSHAENQRRKCQSFYWDSYCCQLYNTKRIVFCKIQCKGTWTDDALYIQVPEQTSYQVPSLNLVPADSLCQRPATAHTLTQNFLQVR